jgi:membrane glycosyltransferase
MPVAISLLLSIPLSVYTSRISFGRAARRWLLRIPEESVVPPVIEKLYASLEESRGHEESTDDEWVIAPTDPLSERVPQEHRRSRTTKPGKIQQNRNLREAAITQGPL